MIRDIRDIKYIKYIKLCKIISEKNEVVNDKNGLSVKCQRGGHCKSTGVIYAIKCKKCKLLYIGETKKALSDRYGGHKYDINNRPDNCDLAKLSTADQRVITWKRTIIEHGIHDQDERRRIEDKYICKLQTHSSSSSGINKDLGAYGKEMYASWSTR